MRIQSFLFSSFLLLACLATGALFTSVSSSEEPASDTITASFGDNTCTVIIKTSGGYPARSVRVATDVSGGVSCSGGRAFYTDSDGEVTLKWVSGCYLRKIYVDGTGYDVDYKDGGNYSIRMK